VSGSPLDVHDHRFAHREPAAIGFATATGARPGGLTWKKAESMLRFSLQTPRVAGLDVTIVNPRLGPDGECATLIAGGVASIRNVL
jgi:arginase family enzyme